VVSQKCESNAQTTLRLPQRTPICLIFLQNRDAPEEFHRELKQLTGIESCQCRKGRIQRNHIACAILVWLRLKNLAYKSRQTIYQIKHGLLSNYLVQQLKRPDIPMFIV
jgi:hypothetical protein